MKKLFEEVLKLEESLGPFTTYEAQNADVVRGVVGELVNRLGYREGTDFKVAGTLIDIAFQADTFEVQEIIRDWGIEELL